MLMIMTSFPRISPLLVEKCMNGITTDPLYPSAVKYKGGVPIDHGCSEEHLSDNVSRSKIKTSTSRVL